MKELPNLDLVRSMAVLFVLADHLLLTFGVNTVGPFDVRWLGIVGVLLFFVLTSLVLMWSLERRPHTLDFYVRRIFRIYPLAILAMFVALAFPHAFSAVSTTPEVLRHGSAKEVLSNLLLAQNLSGARNIVGVTWSLPLEVQMYLVLPALFFFIQRNFAQWPLLLFWTLAVFFSRRSDPQTQNLAVAVPYFLCGTMAYVGFARRRPTVPGWLLPVALIILSLVFLWRPDFHRAWYLCLAAGLAIPSFQQVRSRAVISITHQIAKYSYGIYLTHSFGIALSNHLLSGRPWAAQLMFILLITSAASIAGYHLIELPMIHLGSRLANFAERRYEQRELSHYRMPPPEGNP